jgi:hypothetical protein
VQDWRGDLLSVGLTQDFPFVLLCLFSLIGFLSVDSGVKAVETGWDVDGNAIAVA